MKRQDQRKSKIDKAKVSLEDAIANLIPTSKVNPTALYEEVNAQYRWVSDKSVKNKQPFGATGDVSAETTTATSWAPVCFCTQSGKGTLKIPL